MVDLNKYLNIPFKDEGRDGKGVDCWGLLYMIYKNEFDIELPHYVNHYKTSDDGFAVQNTVDVGREDWEAIGTEKPKLGNLILFKVRGLYRHVGMMIDKKHFIHILKGSECSIEKISALTWNRRIEGIYRYAVDGKRA